MPDVFKLFESKSEKFSNFEKRNLKIDFPSFKKRKVFFLKRFSSFAKRKRNGYSFLKLPDEKENFSTVKCKVQREDLQ